MGGIAGHMAHPYELSWVTNGKQLISFFEQAKSVVKEGNYYLFQGKPLAKKI